MILLYFLYGLAFEGLGLAAYLQLRHEGDFPLKKELTWLAAFGFVGGAAGWVDMFLVSDSLSEIENILSVLRVALHLLTGVFILRFGWGMLNNLDPLPAWSIFVPGILIVPIAFVITYASTTFITPSPIEIPIEIWTRYLLYLPGSLLAGGGFLRQWYIQRKLGMYDVSNLMLGAGLAFLFEAVMMGLIVPAAPYGPASYYNYDRVIHNAFIGENLEVSRPYGLSAWLDYKSVLNATGLPIEIWRMVSAGSVTFFVVKALDVFEAIRKRQMLTLQADRDHAQQNAIETQIQARRTAENWTNALVNISRRIAELDDQAEIDAFAAELTDRFGKFPAEVDNLLHTIAVKQICKQAQIERVDVGPKGAVLAFRQNQFSNPAKLVEWLHRQSGTAKMRPDQKLVLVRVWDAPEDRLRGLRQSLSQLAAIAA